MAGLKSRALARKSSRRHVDAEIENRKAVAPEKYLDDVLADVVDVAFHRPEEYTPGLAADYVGLQRGEDHVAHLVHDGARHDQAGNVIEALLVSLAHEPHALPALFHDSEEIVALADAAADFLQHRLFLQVGEEAAQRAFRLMRSHGLPPGFRPLCFGLSVKPTVALKRMRSPRQRKNPQLIGRLSKS